MKNFTVLFEFEFDTVAAKVTLANRSASVPRTRIVLREIFSVPMLAGSWRAARAYSFPVYCEGLL